MKTIKYSEYLQLEKYINLDEGLEEICPELLKDNDQVRHAYNRLKDARRSLSGLVYESVEPEDWM